MMGHNERIAWGMTAALVDGDDLFVEQVDPADPPRTGRTGSGRDGEVFREEIEVRRTRGAGRRRGAGHARTGRSSARRSRARRGRWR